jgi:hypothetical protein
MAGEIDPVRSGDIVGYVLAGIDEVESRHLPYYEEDIVDSATRRFRDDICEPDGEFVLLFFGAAIADITSDNRHLMLLRFVSRHRLYVRVQSLRALVCEVHQTMITTGPFADDA